MGRDPLNIATLRSQLNDLEKIGFKPSKIDFSNNWGHARTEAFGSLDGNEVEITVGKENVRIGDISIKGTNIAKAYAEAKNKKNFGKTYDDLYDEFYAELEKELSKIGTVKEARRSSGLPVVLRYIKMVDKFIILMRKFPDDHNFEVLSGTNYPKSKLAGLKLNFSVEECDVKSNVKKVVDLIRSLSTKEIKEDNAKPSLGERLSDAGVYPTGTSFCSLRCDKGEVPKEFKLAKVSLEEHPEGADRGGYQYYVKLGKELAVYREPDGWEI